MTSVAVPCEDSAPNLQLDLPQYELARLFWDALGLAQKGSVT